MPCGQANHTLLLLPGSSHIMISLTIFLWFLKQCYFFRNYVGYQPTALGGLVKLTQKAPPLLLRDIPRLAPPLGPVCLRLPYQHSSQLQWNLQTSQPCNEGAYDKAVSHFSFYVQIYTHRREAYNYFLNVEHSPCFSLQQHTILQLFAV